MVSLQVNKLDQEIIELKSKVVQKDENIEKLHAELKKVMMADVKITPSHRRNQS